MKLKTGNIWNAYDQASLFLFTSNSVIKSDGKIVMGAGIAKDVRDRFKGIDKRLADQMKAKEISSLSRYGMLFDLKTKIAAFQTKYHYQDESPLELIEYSTSILAEIAPDFDEIHMTLPGCGHGKRTPEEILPIIEILPDNVFVWDYKK